MTEKTSTNPDTNTADTNPDTGDSSTATATAPPADPKPPASDEKTETSKTATKGGPVGPKVYNAAKGLKAGDISDRDLFVVDGKVTTEVPPGFGGVALARVGEIISPARAAHIAQLF